MENAGLSFSWDSESQQKHFHVISLGGQDAIEKGQKPERAGFKSQLPPFIICVTRTNLASQACFSRTSQGSITTWQAAGQTECGSPWRRGFRRSPQMATAIRLRSPTSTWAAGAENARETRGTCPAPSHPWAGSEPLWFLHLRRAQLHLDSRAAVRLE